MKRRTSPLTEKKRPPELDDILPMPAGSGIPYVRDGDGKDILDNDTVVVVEMTYRAMYIMWEQAEAMAKRSYTREVVGPFANHAAAIREACYAFRNRRHESVYGEPLKVMSEERARKARKILAEMKAQEAKSTKKGAQGRSPAPNAQDEPAAANPAKKKERCTSRFVADGHGSQCVGPKDHNGKHKDRNGRRW